MANNATQDFHKGDESYLASIEQYRSNQKLYDKLMQNPFMNSKVGAFSPTFWQRLGSLLGDNSAEDSYYSGIMSNRNQWMSEVLEAFRQQEYDSPLEQAERLRAAGRNPDLEQSLTPGAAAENDQPFTPVEWPTDSVASGIGNISLQFISQLIGLGQSFQGLKLGNQQLIAGEIANNGSARDFVLNQIAGTSFFNSENDLDHMSPSDLANNIISASSKVDWSVYSPSTRKLIRRMFNRYAKDVSSGKSPMAVESLKSELRSRITQNNKSAVDVASSPLFDEDFNEFLRKVASVFGKAEYDAQVLEYEERLEKAGYGKDYYKNLSGRASADASNARSGYEKDYYSSMDGKLIGESENTSATARSVTDSQSAISEGMWTEIYKICKDTNSWYGTLGLILIPFLRSMASQFGVGFGRYGKSGKFGVTTIGM